MMGRLFNNSFFKSVAALSSGAFVAQLIALLITPYVTRLYSPVEFGILAMFLTCASIFVSIVTGKYEYAIVLPEEDMQARKLVSLSILLSGYLCGVLLVLLFIFSYFGISLFPRLNKLEMLLVPVFVWFSTRYEALKYYAIRHRNYREVSASAIVKAAVSAFILIICGVMGLNEAGLLLAAMCSVVAGNLSLSRLFLKEIDTYTGNKFNLRGYKEVMRRFRNFPRYSMPATFLNALSAQLPVLFLTTMFSVSAAGFFSLANRVLSLPSQLVGTAIGEVFLRKATEVKHDREKLREITWSLYKSLLMIGVIPTGLIFFFGEDLFLFVFGVEWGKGGVFASYLICWILFAFIASPLSNIFIVQERQQISLIYQMSLFISRILLFFVAFIGRMSSDQAMITFGIAGACLYFTFIFYLLVSLGLHWVRVLSYTVLVLILGMSPFYLMSLWE